jgi:hypothetical protein
MVKVYAVIGALALLAACELEDEDTRRRGREQGPESSAEHPGSLVDDCVEYTKLAAFLGDPNYGPRWDDVGHDEHELRDRCEEMSEATLQSISLELVATEEFLAAAASPTTYAPPVAPQPIAAAPPLCHESYSGACVPIASDVDCAAGTGDGPEYIAGPVYVGAADPYGLDHDGDGVACEPRP